MHDIGNSLPSRNSSLVKRKIPDTFYAPPVLKTQVFSASSQETTQPSVVVSAQQRSHINHSHTNSLPVDTMHPFKPTPTTNIHPSGSVNNLTDLTQNNQFTPMKQQLQQQVYTSYSPMHLSSNENKINQPNFNLNQSQHAKTYSLPVSFDQSQQQQPQQQHQLQPIYSTGNHHLLQPPIKNKNIGDIPLPEGYTYETTSTGQIYFINHITKTTQWHDPRSYYNLPMNQNDINKDLRTSITNTIPLPPHWEEARTSAGEVYYINHANQTTTWSDPRLSIYMQQENLKYSNQNNMNTGNNSVAQTQTTTTSNNNNILNSKMNNASNSSLYSPYSSSVSSISTTDTTASTTPSTASSSTSASINSINFDFTTNHLNNNTNQLNFQQISNLQKSLDQLLNKKYHICKELEELSKKEMFLKSKLSQQDLDDVLRLIKSNDTSMSSFSQYDSTGNTGSSTDTASTTCSTSSTNTNVINSKSADKLNTTTDNELDSTLVVGDNSTLNTSNI